jgi:hypothetical protein
LLLPALLRSPHIAEAVGRIGSGKADIIVVVAIIIPLRPGRILLNLVISETYVQPNIENEFAGEYKKSCNCVGVEIE